MTHTSPVPPQSIQPLVKLRAVPPPSLRPPMTAPSPTIATDAAPRSAPKQGLWSRWSLLGGTLIGIGCLSLVLVPHRVTGPGEVSATQEAVETLSMPAPGGTVQQVIVKANQKIAANQPAIALRLDSLVDRLTQAQQQLIQSQTVLETRRQHIAQQQAALREAIAQTTTAQQAVDRLRQEVNPASQPQVQGWQAQQVATQAEITSLQATLNALSGRIEQVKPAVEAEAVSPYFLEGLLTEQRQLQSQIAQKYGELATSQARIDDFSLNQQTALSQAEAALAERQAQRRSAEQAIQSAIEEYEAQETLLSAQAAEVTQLEQRLDQLELLHTTLAGTIITPQQEIDALRGRYVEAGQPLLTVMNPEKLTVEMWVRQEDRDLVTPGMAAEFRPQSGRWEHYPAIVETVSAQTEFHETEQKPMVRVTLRLQAASQPLQLNTTGTARILAEPLPFYHKVTREFLKVVPLQKLLAF